MAVSPFSDGTPLASQWPIPPLHFFDYEIKPAVGMAGTYFYHSHAGFQAVSAAGPLIVDDLDNPYDYDEERIVFLHDVFVKNISTIEAGLVASPLGWSGETAMIMVNGKGGGSANGVACNSSLSTIDVEPGKTYRVRFIGGTALTFASIAIEGHDVLRVIEADGCVSSQTITSEANFQQIVHETSCHQVPPSRCWTTVFCASEGEIPAYQVPILHADRIPRTPLSNPWLCGAQLWQQASFCT